MAVFLAEPALLIHDSDLQTRTMTDHGIRCRKPTTLPRIIRGEIRTGKYSTYVPFSVGNPKRFAHGCRTSVTLQKMGPGDTPS